jgi:hypothetical protein
MLSKIFINNKNILKNNLCSLNSNIFLNKLNIKNLSSKNNKNNVNEKLDIINNKINKIDKKNKYIEQSRKIKIYSNDDYILKILTRALTKNKTFMYFTGVIVFIFTFLQFAEIIVNTYGIYLNNKRENKELVYKHLKYFYKNNIMPENVNTNIDKLNSDAKNVEEKILNNDEL